MQLRIALLLAVVLAGCASNGARIDRRAESAGMSRVRYDGAAYPAFIYMKSELSGVASADAPLVVFLEGDGLPWPNGRTPATDPTTHQPVALELLLNTPQSAAYVTRPCYHGLQPKHCVPTVWTTGRYSEEVVNSMTNVVREALRLASRRKVILVGYSGGGALAVLVAERLENVATVITIGANLDTDAWTKHHRYLPLSESLNPTRSDRAHPWPEIHFRGERDEVVPPSTTSAYFERYPAARNRIIPAYDHVCCWPEGWPTLLRAD